ncbi:pentapeptide repeat-containing protein [Pseudovibrio axinellae]|nr:pentapeptide repeat-containing protein [Pseudovibrio axinellae]
MTSSETCNTLDYKGFCDFVEAGKPIENAELEANWLEGKDLTDIEFKNCYFEPESEFDSVDFRNSRWKDTEFAACTFKNCDLREATFENCGFYFATTRAGSSFRHCDLSDVEFHSCDLRISSFPFAHLFCVSFQNCRMGGTFFEGSDFGKSMGARALKPRASFTDCQMAYASLNDLDLDDAIMTDCDLSNTNLSNTSLSGADLQRSSIEYAETDRLNLSYADLRGGQIGTLLLQTLSGYRGLMISANQQHLLLTGLGIKVEPD